MCFPTPKAPTPVNSVAAPPPPPPVNLPTIPLINNATMGAPEGSGATYNPNQRRGTNALTIGLANPGGSGSGLSLGQ